MEGHTLSNSAPDVTDMVAERNEIIPLGKGKEVFDAELYGACMALEVAQTLQQEGPVTVLLDSQAAISRLSHLELGPGQALAARAHKAA